METSKLKIYEYPTIKLTDIEESSSISLLVLGKTWKRQNNFIKCLY
jgi:hypothetical protein